MKSIETVTDIINNQKSSDKTEIQKEPTPSSSLLEKDYVYNTEDKSETSLNKEQSITKRIETSGGYRFNIVRKPLFLFCPHFLSQNFAFSSKCNFMQI